MEETNFYGRGVETETQSGDSAVSTPPSSVRGDERKKSEFTSDSESGVTAGITR
jgi:hypothetical protein